MLIRKSLSVVVMLAAAITLTGCGGDTHESVMREMIGQMKAMVDAMKSVKDKESATAQVSSFKAIGDKMKDIKARADKLPKLSTEEENALEQKLKGEMEPVMKDLMTETFRVAALGPEVQAELQSAMESLKDLK